MLRTLHRPHSCSDQQMNPEDRAFGTVFPKTGAPDFAGSAAPNEGEQAVACSFVVTALAEQRGDEKTSSRENAGEAIQVVEDARARRPPVRLVLLTALAVRFDDHSRPVADSRDYQTRSDQSEKMPDSHRAHACPFLRCTCLRRFAVNLSTRTHPSAADADLSREKRPAYRAFSLQFPKICVTHASSARHVAPGRVLRRPRGVALGTLAPGLQPSRALQSFQGRNVRWSCSRSARLRCLLQRFRPSPLQE